MGQVRRELEGEDRVVQAQPVTHGHAHRRVVGQLQQAAVLVGDLQFPGRTQHAAALDAAQLAHADLEGLGVCLGVIRRRQLGTHGGQRHANADPRVRRAADDLQQLGPTGVDLAHAQAVGLGVRLGRDDAGHHHPREGRGHGTQVLDLHAGHGQQVGQGLAAQRGVAELAQPRLGELHGGLFGEGVGAVMLS